MKLTLDFPHTIVSADEDLIMKAWSLMQQHCPPHLADTGLLTMHYDSVTKKEGAEVFYGSSSSTKQRIFKKSGSSRMQETVKLTEVIKHDGKIFDPVEYDLPKK